MSIVHELEPDTSVDSDAGEDVCFYCYRQLNAPVVMWMGSTSNIYLHPACVVELGIRLFRDVHQIECATNSYVTARTTPELRLRLLHEEMRR